MMAGRPSTRQGRRVGHEKLVAANSDVRLGTDAMVLTSSAFSPGGQFPVRFIADTRKIGPRGIDHAGRPVLPVESGRSPQS